MRETQRQTTYETADGAVVNASRTQQTNGANIAATAPGNYKVIRRNGKVTPFDASKIELAITKAFLDVEKKLSLLGGQHSAPPSWNEWGTCRKQTR